MSAYRFGFPNITCRTEPASRYVKPTREIYRVSATIFAGLGAGGLEAPVPQCFLDNALDRILVFNQKNCRQHVRHSFPLGAARAGGYKVHTSQTFPGKSGTRETGGLAPVGEFFGLDLFPDEADPQIFAVYSFELTATIGKSNGRKQKKELVQSEPLNRGLNLKCCSDI
jgi:hypothetical protein